MPIEATTWINRDAEHTIVTYGDLDPVYRHDVYLKSIRDMTAELYLFSPNDQAVLNGRVARDLRTAAVYGETHRLLNDAVWVIRVSRDRSSNLVEALSVQLITTRSKLTELRLGNPRDISIREFMIKTNWCLGLGL